MLVLPRLVAVDRDPGEHSSKRVQLPPSLSRKGDLKGDTRSHKDSLAAIAFGRECAGQPLRL